jgi:hypothetical protein
MPALVAGIHVFREQGVDGRDSPAMIPDKVAQGNRKML